MFAQCQLELSHCVTAVILLSYRNFTALLLHACLQGSALCAENAATVERLIEQGKAQYKPLALATTYAADKKTQVSHPHSFHTNGAHVQTALQCSASCSP